MAKKIFVSYKYGDSGVNNLPGNSDTRARHYVDSLQDALGEGGHINKGEDDGEDMSQFQDETIASKLRDKIYDSSITIVLVSKNMIDPFKKENEQWIPWEISYSLKEIVRSDKTSRTNALLAVIIPDENNSYEYFIQHVGCPHCGAINWRVENLFGILRQNMFNRKNPNKVSCGGSCGLLNMHSGSDHSYIHPVKWDDFISDISRYLDHALWINENINDYNIEKTVE